MPFHIARQFLAWIFLVPAVGGSVYAVLCLLAMIRLRTRARQPSKHSFSAWPPVTVLKPVYGLEKNLRENLRSVCCQDYPDYQVVFSAQRRDDPAIPLLKEIQQEFGSARVTIAIEECRAGTNGKINNMIGGLKHARHDILVIGDSDVLLRPDYLKTIVAPLADREVGFVCTLYKAACADNWYEKVELLTLNADLMTSIIFAHVTGAAKFCLGASTALRRSTLEEIGGLPALADYLVEDYEMGRRIWNSGKKNAIIPYFIDTIMDLKSPSQWWGHQVYWDQNNRAARPIAFSATVLLRSVPFALLYAAVRPGDITGLSVLLGALVLRLATAAVNLGWGLRDREGLRSLYLLPFRDIASLISFFLAYTKRTTVWRGAHFTLTRDGRLVAQEGNP
ncbi:MAG: bacteriohopanetetrol glucosamine biosynthesis glycosyltransferase HpnI [Acidobacteriia bacterium]|nr:bacteriohopanetetrol glucosamine biosynthesis glycosyltransferase HpnI [Terriglobia bacterium]